MPEQLVPETRLERFLSSIVYNTDVPEERRNRLERWLGAILKTNPPPDAPYDRLERWLKEIYDNADYSAQFSGLNVEFWSRGNEQIKSLIVDIKPYQDFNGYDKPWAPGAGKNLLENNVQDATYRGITVTRNSDDSLTFSGTASTSMIIIGNMALGTYSTTGQFDGVKHIPNGRYVFSTGFLRGTGIRLQLTGANTSSASDVEIITATDTQTNVVIDDTYSYNWVRIYVAAGTYENVVLKPMIYLETESDTTYEPYANICPITGFNQVTLKRYGETESDSPLVVNVALGQTVYGGYVDVITGELTVTHGNIASYDGEEINGEWLSSMDSYYPDTDPTEGAQVVYELDVPIKSQLTANQIATLIGTNHVKASLVNGTTEIEADITLKV